MLVVNKRPFYTGFLMALGFGAVLLVMFLPVIGGRTPLEASDDLFNSVAKDSSYYIPALREHAHAYRDTPLDMRLTLADAESAAKAAAVLKSSGADASASGAVVSLRSSLGHVIGAALDQSDVMFKNRGNAASAEGLAAKEATFAWWQTLKQVYKQLRAKSEFQKASDVEEVISKGVEVGYNFYGIAPRPASANVGILGLALVFYLVYTMWWGYAIMWLCDGIGLQMKASGKREH